MSKSKKVPKQTDPSNPEWTKEEAVRAKLFSALPDSLNSKLSRRGRPPLAEAKQAVSLRLSPDVLRRFRATGKGWQTRMNEALREWLDNHGTA